MDRHERRVNRSPLGEPARPATPGCPASRTLSALVLAVLAGSLPAHGGAYRGPNGPVPGPTTNGPVVSGPGSRATTLHGGTDRTRWQLWWEFNKDAYLRTRPGRRDDGSGSGHALSTRQRKDEVLPALRRALSSTNNRDIASSCMVAIAKIGVPPRDFQVRPLLEARLARGDQEIRETAALALGIRQDPDAIPTLRALLLDQAEGRRLMQQDSVDDRTRSFAAYALGLIGQAQDSIEVRGQILDVLEAALRSKAESDRNVHVAVLTGVRLLATGHADATNARERRLQWRCVALLEWFLDLDLGKARQQVQAHVAPAIARVLGRGKSDDHERIKRRLAENLLARRRTHHTLPQSAALALGQLALPPEASPGDAVYSKTLLRAAREAKDTQVRYFCLIALGQIGGPTNEAALLAHYGRTKGSARSWTALALGLLAHHAAERPTASQQEAPAQRIGPRLLRGLDATANPEERGAHAVALGLARYTPAAEPLRALLKKLRNRQQVAGYLCIGLSLMDDRSSVPLMVDILRDARRRPLLMAQAARGLARLGERSSAAVLHPMLRRTDAGTITLAAAANALGQIGDAGSVAPMLAVLDNDEMPKLLRAFAAAGLGTLADDDPLPWNAWIGRDANYRALVGTLSNGSSGVLDIL